MSCLNSVFVFVLLLFFSPFSCGDFVNNSLFFFFFPPFFGGGGEGGSVCSFKSMLG